MTGDTSGLRMLVSRAIDAMQGWTVSRWAPGLFGRDTDHLMHLSFVVDVPDTSVSNRDGRQRLTEGLLVESTIEVQWAYRLKVDAQSASYGEMLDAEQKLVAAVRGIETAHVTVDRLSRRAGPEGWIIGTARFRSVHRYALT